MHLLHGARDSAGQPATSGSHETASSVEPAASICSTNSIPTEAVPSAVFAPSVRMHEGPPLARLDLPDTREGFVHVGDQLHVCAELAAHLHAERVGGSRHHDFRGRYPVAAPSSRAKSRGFLPTRR